MAQNSSLSKSSFREILAGDSLYSLAEEVFGDHRYWREIALFNQLDLFSPLISGEKIRIPTQKQVTEILTGVDRLLPRQVSSVLGSQLEKLDLSGLKQPGSPDHTLIDWIL